MAEQGHHARWQARLCRDLAAARRCAGRRLRAVRPAIWPPLVETLRRWVRAEAGAGRLLPWVPVAFGTGIAFYFAADHEPVLPVAAIAAIALLRRRRSCCGGRRCFRLR